MGKKHLSFSVLVSAGRSFEAHRKALLTQWADLKQRQLKTSIPTFGSIQLRSFLNALIIETQPRSNSLKLRRSSSDRLVTHIMGP